ncbi:hypothetical protein DIPPA_09527 [Diplonema papillatum]|nr:hypothetical protein DIPPA_09527 [Diplonema papillatum]
MELEQARKLSEHHKTTLTVSTRGMGMVTSHEEEAALRENLGAEAVADEGSLWDAEGFPRGVTASQAQEYLRSTGWAGVNVIRLLPKRKGQLAVVRGQEPPAWILHIEGTEAVVTVSTVRRSLRPV